MRQIKFRGKRVDNGEWVKGYLWVGNNQSYITPHNLGIGYDADTHRLTACAHEIDPSTIGQFTGLCDRKGNEIYEGDIVKFYTAWPALPEDIEEWSRKAVVGYEDGSFTNCRQMYKTGEENHKVIGNVFENGELLND